MFMPGNIVSTLSMSRFKLSSLTGHRNVTLSYTKILHPLTAGSAQSPHLCSRGVSNHITLHQRRLLTVISDYEFARDVSSLTNEER